MALINVWAIISDPAWTSKSPLSLGLLEQACWNPAGQAVVMFFAPRTSQTWLSVGA